MRAWMLATVVFQTAPLVVASISTVTIALVTLTLTGAVWTVGWAFLDVALTIARLKLIRDFDQHAGDASTSREIDHVALMRAGLLWIGLYGLGLFGCMMSGEPAIMILAGLCVAGTAGAISSRNAATPRYAILAMLFCGVPFEFASAISAERGMIGVALVFPCLLAGLVSMLMQNNRTLLRTYDAELTSYRLASTDPLTGLWNRKHLHEILQLDAFVEFRHASSSYCVLCLDLDGFKQINDSDGHSAGDSLLKFVADSLTALVRKNDKVFRIGGDEFIVFLLNATADDGKTVAERIITALNQPINIGLVQPLHVGVSIGGATPQQPWDSAKMLIAAADKALYVAKRSGKGMYCYAGRT